MTEVGMNDDDENTRWPFDNCMGGTNFDLERDLNALNLTNDSHINDQSENTGAENDILSGERRISYLERYLTDIGHVKHNIDWVSFFFKKFF